MKNTEEIAIELIEIREKLGNLYKNCDEKGKDFISKYYKDILNPTLGFPEITFLISKKITNLLNEFQKEIEKDLKDLSNVDEDIKRKYKSDTLKLVNKYKNNKHK